MSDSQAIVGVLAATTSSLAVSDNMRMQRKAKAVGKQDEGDATDGQTDAIR